jgi:hypothetical protein
MYDPLGKLCLFGRNKPSSYQFLSRVLGDHRAPPLVGQGVSRGLVAKIPAAHLAEQLRLAGFVVMQRPPTPVHTAPGTGPDGGQARDPRR